MKRVALFILLSICAVVCAIAGTAEDDDRGNDAVIIPVEFTDTTFTCGLEDFERLAAGARQYFSEQDFPRPDFRFTVASPVTLSKGISHYGANNTYGRDRRIGPLAYEACVLADEEVDFSLYAHVFILVAGGNEGEDGVEDHIWAQNWNLEAACKESGDPDKMHLTLDGREINDFYVFSELKGDAEHYAPAGIGTLCHEFGHALGLPDFYDTDGELSGGLSKGLWGSTSLMDKGNFNGDGDNPPYLNAIELDELGLGKCVDLTLGSHTLEPIGKSHKYMRYKSGVDGKYLLFECRKAEGRDSDIGGSGMLIYSINKSDESAGRSSSYGRELTAAQRWGDYNEVNCRPDNECAKLVAAIPLSDSVSGAFFPQDTVDSYGPFGDFTISDIRLNSDGSVSFEVLPNILSGLQVHTFQNAAIVSWTCSTNETFSLIMDSDTLSTDIKPYSSRPWEYSYTITGLEPSTTHTLSVGFSDRFREESSFKTAAYYKSIPPYINLSGAERYDDGSFAKGTKIPLKLDSAPDAESVSWYFDGAEISVAADGYYTLLHGGSLKAGARLSDGTVITILKEVTVK